ncbi:hypothetical protein EJ03DRAFT_330125 [Teratosphaeria nubilosa]|uniref:Uncharacterized protein n=1 Tax=Teratosphaeria nubilosa TaxID=161662 RepID=A0A6G1L0I4_9PEZI|nr:hypothetical protein EJ03DRAFT_330125 [Teratosphaeria nubilosa]
MTNSLRASLRPQRSGHQDVGSQSRVAAALQAVSTVRPSTAVEASSDDESDDGDGVKDPDSDEEITVVREQKPHPRNGDRLVINQGESVVQFRLSGVLAVDSELARSGDERRWKLFQQRRQGGWDRRSGRS